MKTKLTAENLKQELWTTLSDLKTGNVQVSQARVMAEQAREITRTTKLELEITKQAGCPITNNLKEFANIE